MPPEAVDYMNRETLQIMKSPHDKLNVLPLLGIISFDTDQRLHILGLM